MIRRTYLLWSVIRLIETYAGVGIPYPPVLRAGRPSNYGYVDVKRFPESVYTIPELQGNPHLFDLVRSVNQPSSVFRTLGCNSLPERAYVHLAFEVLHWNSSKSCYRTLFSDYFDWHNKRGNPNEPIDVEFRICPASYLEHRFQGWSASVHFDLLVSAPGQITELKLFLEEASGLLRPQLTNCSRTMSDCSAVYAEANVGC